MKRKTFFIVSFFLGCTLFLTFLCFCREKQESGTPRESTSAAARKISEEEAARFVRFSLGRTTTEEEIRQTAAAAADICKKRS